jgi:hypothetical protein
MSLSITPKKIAIAAFLLATTFTASLFSVLSPFTQHFPAADASAFLTIGQGLLDGKTPYIDFFDHKGPLLYFINAAGLLLGGNAGVLKSWTGVWFIELFLMGVSVLFTYKTARLFATSFPAAIATFFTFVFLAAFFYQGNLPEEYAIAPACASLYLYARHFLSEKKLTKKETLFLGAAFVSTLLLKPNMFAVWAAFSGVLCIQELLRKEWKASLSYALFFWLGALAFSAPFLLFLLASGAFSEFINQCWLFNFRYASYESSPLVFVAKFISVINRHYIWAAILIAFVKTVRTYGTKEFSFYLALFFSIPCAVALIANSPHLGERNFMVVVPLLTPALALAGKWLWDYFKTFPPLFPQVVKAAFPVLVFAFVFHTPLRYDADELANSFRDGFDRKNALSKIKFKRVTEAVAGKTVDGDTVTVVGNNSALYYTANRPPVSKYIFQYPPITMGPEILREYQAAVLKAKPRLIFVVWPFLAAAKDCHADIPRLAVTYPEIARLLAAEYTLLHEETGMTAVFIRKTKP